MKNYTSNQSSSHILKIKTFESSRWGNIKGNIYLLWEIIKAAFKFKKMEVRLSKEGKNKDVRVTKL